VFIADVIDCDTGHEYRLNSLILSEAEFRSRLSDLGLIVAATEAAQFKAERARVQGTHRGEIHAACGRPEDAEQLQDMELAALLVPATPLAWGARHFLLQGLADELRRDAARAPDSRKFGLSQVRCLHRAMEIGWQWMLEAPEIMRDLRAIDRTRAGAGASSRLPILDGLASALRRKGFKGRAAWIEQRSAAMTRA
jgi:hypothetical protein